MRDANFYDTVYNFKDHIIVLGYDDIEILTRFLLHQFKFFIRSHFTPKILVIGERPIDDAMKALMSQGLFQDSVNYLSVSSIDRATLTKGAFDSCGAIYYLTS